MKPILIALIIALISSPLLAMSKTPEPYKPPQWHEASDAATDAGYALKNDDQRLLGYLTRDVMVPGIDPAQKESLSKTCGVRMLKGFGDVVRSDAHLQQMKAMRAYVVKYNEIIAAQCGGNASDN